jgi:hypothetical protein
MTATTTLQQTSLSSDTLERQGPTMPTNYSEAPSKFVDAPNGIEHAYREVGDGQLPWCTFSISATTSTTGTQADV